MFTQSTLFHGLGVEVLENSRFDRISLRLWRFRDSMSVNVGKIGLLLAFDLALEYFLFINKSLEHLTLAINIALDRFYGVNLSIDRILYRPPLFSQSHHR